MLSMLTMFCQTNIVCVLLTHIKVILLDLICYARDGEIKKSYLN